MIGLAALVVILALGPAALAVAGGLVRLGVFGLLLVGVLAAPFAWVTPHQVAVNRAIHAQHSVPRVDVDVPWFLPSGEPLIPEGAKLVVLHTQVTQPDPPLERFRRCVLRPTFR